jgi:adenine-specific DNA glycosylase
MKPSRRIRTQGCDFEICKHYECEECPICDDCDIYQETKYLQDEAAYQARAKREAMEA